MGGRGSTSKSQPTTRFEREYRDAASDPDKADEIIRRRKAELEDVERRGRSERNGYRVRALAQESARLRRELGDLEELI